MEKDIPNNYTHLTNLVNQLRATLGMMEVALGAISDAIVWTGEDGRVQWCNAAFDRLVERSHILLLNQPLSELIPLMQSGQPIPEIDYPNTQVLQSEYATTEYEFQSSERSLILEISGNRVELADGKSFAVLVIRDVTAKKQDESDRKQAEAALGQSELRYRALVTATAQGVFTTNAAGEVLEDIPIWRALTGMSEAQAKGFGWLESIHPDDRQPTMQAWMEAVHTGNLYEIEQRVRVASGEYRLFLVRAVPVLDDQGNIQEWVGTQIDITDQKRAESALRQSEERFRALYESTNIAIFLRDDKATDRENFLTCNQAAQRLFGYSREQITNNYPVKLSPPVQPNGQNSVELANQHLAIAYAQGSHRFEWIYRRANGTDFPAEVQLTVFEANGNKLVQGIIQDLTERKQAEAILQRRAQVEQLFSSISRQFIDQNAQTAILFSLETIAEFLQAEHACLFTRIDRHRHFQMVYEWCAPQVAPVSSEARRSLIEQFPWFYDRILSGQTVHIPCVAEMSPTAIAEKMVLDSLSIQSLIAVPMLHSGKVVGFLGLDVVHWSRTWSQEDISLLQRASQLIAIGQVRQQAEEKFTKVFRASPSPISLTTLADRRFIEVNPSYLKLCGCTAEELIGHTARELRLGVTSEKYSEVLQQFLKTGSLYNQEVEFLTRSGETRIVLLSIELINLSGTDCILNMINDITERKRLENEFISLVSHELRTPLTSLIGGLYLLGSGQVATLTPKGQNLLNIATTNTERLIRLVNDILDLERMRSGKITLQPAKCNVANLLIQATEAMQAMAEQAEIQLVVEPLDVELLVDSDRILQTLTNLLSNAIKFSESGSSVWLSAEVRSQEYGKDSPVSLAPLGQSPSLPVSPPYLLIAVRDQGRGIPPDKIQMIFEPFQQVDISDSRQKGGTGLGLSICRNIIQQHGGKLWVESVLGQGSTFYILLPLTGENRESGIGRSLL
ncbi:PAS domain S-box protein [Nostoc sp. FACHB-973]|nr:PAS domain S-box protein [Nostoc sp. FACHB-973]